MLIQKLWNSSGTNLDRYGVRSRLFCVITRTR